MLFIPNILQMSILDLSSHDDFYHHWLYIHISYH